jgi:hypothetical protein
MWRDCRRRNRPGMSPPLRRARAGAPGGHRPADTSGQAGRNPMSDLQAIADRVEIEALRGEFTDAVMMRDYDRVASLFTPDGALRMPNVPSIWPAGRRSAPGVTGRWPCGITSCRPPTRARSSSTATPRPAAPASPRACLIPGQDHPQPPRCAPPPGGTEGPGAPAGLRLPPAAGGWRARPRWPGCRPAAHARWGRRAPPTAAGSCSRPGPGPS